LERSTTFLNAEIRLKRSRFADHLGDWSVGPRPLRAAQRFALVQQLRRGLELLVLEQAAHQRLARILLGIFLRRVGARQQHPRLDVDQRRRHHQELPRDVQVHLLHQVDVFDVLRRDQGDRNVVDAQLVPLDQVQQQVERALEGGQLEAEAIVDDRLGRGGLR
jgi:hypothetical protein